MPLIICEINLILLCSGNCIISSDIAANRATTFAITDTKLYVPFVTLSAKLFWSTSEIDLRTYNIRKIATIPGDDFTTGCLLDYPYFKEYYKTIAIALSKQHLMLIRKQYNRLILLETYIDQIIQQCFSLLKKQK